MRYQKKLKSKAKARKTKPDKPKSPPTAMYEGAKVRIAAANNEGTLSSSLCVFLQ